MVTFFSSDRFDCATMVHHGRTVGDITKRFCEKKISSGRKITSSNPELPVNWWNKSFRKKFPACFLVSSLMRKTVLKAFKTPKLRLLLRFFLRRNTEEKI